MAAIIFGTSAFWENAAMAVWGDAWSGE